MAHILVADDEENIRQLIALALKSRGHTVVEAPDGRVAAALIQHLKFDLIITDILMPERDGFELLTAGRQQADFPPVIAITGLIADAPHFLKVASGLGAKLTLAKPFTSSQLLAAVDSVLGTAGFGKGS